MLAIFLEVTGAILLAMAGTALGYACSRLKRPWWLVGYFVPLLIVIAIGLTRKYETLAFVAPFSWIALGRRIFLLTALSSTLLFMTPLSRLRTRGQKRAVMALMVTVVMYYGILPFLVPLITYPYMNGIETRLDRDGVCLQSTEYNCGPAAAVTALRILGIEAHEGEIAIGARTSRFIGTPASLLCPNLMELYGKEGLRATYRSFEGIDALRDHLPVIAVTKFGFLVDHYVVVLEVREREVVIGDPLRGKVILSHDAFQERWRSTGIELSRN